MATSDNPFVTIPMIDIDELENHQHHVPIMQIDDAPETLEDEYGDPALDSDGEPLIELDNIEPIADPDDGVLPENEPEDDDWEEEPLADRA
jgi:hypothetical protein